MMNILVNDNIQDAEQGMLVEKRIGGKELSTNDVEGGTNKEQEQNHEEVNKILSAAWTTSHNLQDNEPISNGCKPILRQKWSINTFFEFYDRVLGTKIFEHFGKLLSKIVHTDLLKDEKNWQRTRLRDLHVLEVAAGTGRITAHLFEQLMAQNEGAKCKLTATDMSAAAVETAKKTLADKVTRNPNFTLLPDVDMADLPFEENSVDAIVCGFGLMFPKDKAKVAREFKNKLRPGGQVFATMFHRNTWFENIQVECQQNFGQKSRLLTGALQLSDPEFIRAIFAREGLDSVLEELSYDFSVNKSETRELLINSCVLLEEFNQASPFQQNQWLNAMTDSVHRNEKEKKISVKVWLLKCTLSETLKPFGDCKDQIEKTFNFKTFQTFRDSDTKSKAIICNDEKEGFLLEHGTEYDEAAVDNFRSREFSRLDANKEIYLDYVGGNLAPSSLLQRQFEALRGRVVGNPHR